MRDLLIRILIACGCVGCAHVADKALTSEPPKAAPQPKPATFLERVVVHDQAMKPVAAVCFYRQDDATMIANLCP